VDELVTVHRTLQQEDEDAGADVAAPDPRAAGQEPGQLGLAAATAGAEAPRPTATGTAPPGTATAAAATTGAGTPAAAGTAPLGAVLVVAGAAATVALGVRAAAVVTVAAVAVTSADVGALLRVRPRRRHVVMPATRTITTVAMRTNRAAEEEELGVGAECVHGGLLYRLLVFDHDISRW
jgi:hypothetical protein